MYGTFDAPNDYRNYLQHHGVKGQKWGVKNGPPYPIQKISKKRVQEKYKNYIPIKDRPHKDYNLDKWGTSKDTNVLWVTGISGSGKSTIAKELANKNNADIINLDLYTFKTADKYTKDMSKSFNAYLNKKVPNWKTMQKEAYEVLTKTDRRGKGKQAAGKWFDTIEAAIIDYGRLMYGEKKVVAEGVQILDETLFYNNKQALKNQPVIVMNTSVDDSILSRMYRDNITDINKQFSPERIKQMESWQKDLDYLINTMGNIRMKDI